MLQGPARIRMPAHFCSILPNGNIEPGFPEPVGMNGRAWVRSPFPIDFLPSQHLLAPKGYGMTHK